MIATVASSEGRAGKTTTAIYMAAYLQEKALALEASYPFGTLIGLDQELLFLRH
jgi:hypothetical protein